jgi:dTDP-glucose pyrophosphorylase
VKVIVPCCGESSRYPSQPPKWMLPSPEGQPMLTLAVSGLEVDLEDIVVVILREHDEQYSARRGICDAFGRDMNIVVLEERTSSQAETVAEALQSLSLDEAFLVKDSDNCFDLAEIEADHDYVSVDSLNNHDLINPRNKSYVQVDHNGLITNIREKEVISDLFSVGGYFFTSPEQFLETYAGLTDMNSSWGRELYISDIVGALILEGTPVTPRRVEGYQDWGTIQEWRRTLLASRTIFVALDGFVFERGSEHFSPRFSEVKVNQAVVDELHRISQHGHSVVLLSIRPKAQRELTEQQLAEVGLSDLQVVYDCHSTAWRMVGAPHAVLPFNTVEAIELEAHDPNLSEKLLE